MQMRKMKNIGWCFRSCWSQFKNILILIICSAVEEFSILSFDIRYFESRDPYFRIPQKIQMCLEYSHLILGLSVRVLVFWGLWSSVLTTGCWEKRRPSESLVFPKNKFDTNFRPIFVEFVLNDWNFDLEYGDPILRSKFFIVCPHRVKNGFLSYFRFS